MTPDSPDPAVGLLRPEALLSADAGFRSIVEHGTNLFYAHTADHALTYVSPQTQRFFDCEPAEALVRWTEFATEHPVNVLGFEHTKRALDTGERQPPYELELRGKKGRRIWVEVNEAPVLNEGKVVGIVGALTDITERKRAEEARQKAVQQMLEIERLKEQDRFRTQFLNTLAHELATPLTPITVQMRLLQTASQDRPLRDFGSNLRVVERSVRRLSALIQESLDAARLQADRLILKRSTVDLGELARSTVEAYRDVAARKGVTLGLRADDGLRCEADAGRLLQVLDNLVGNAVKFTGHGGRVDVTATRAGTELVVRVHDNGIGFEPKADADLFQPFRQLHAPTQVSEPGTGLGLFVSRGIVELHGGRIGGESPGPGRGATFWFAVPAS